MKKFLLFFSCLTVLCATAQLQKNKWYAGAGLRYALSEISPAQGGAADLFIACAVTQRQLIGLDASYLYVAESKSPQTMFAAGPVYRYYKSFHDPAFALFAQALAQYRWLSGNAFSSPVSGNGLLCQLSPGFAWWISKNFCVEVNFGALAFRSLQWKDSNHLSTNSSNLGFNYDLQTLRIGVMMRF